MEPTQEDRDIATIVKHSWQHGGSVTKERIFLYRETAPGRWDTYAAANDPVNIQHAAEWLRDHDKRLEQSTPKT
jgi:hypothetical protein